jgi:hypothetical protein
LPKNRLFRLNVYSRKKENINYWIVNPFVSDPRTVPLESTADTVHMPVDPAGNVNHTEADIELSAR